MPMDTSHREAIHHTPSHRARMARFYHRDGSHLSLLPIPSSNLDNHHLAHICRYLYVKELHDKYVIDIIPQ